MPTVPAFVLAVNLAYLLLVSSTTGRAVSAMGCGVALLLLVMPVVSADARTRIARYVPLSLPLGSAWVPLVLAFGVPLFLIGVSSIGVSSATGFQRVDGRVWVLLGWLAAIAFLAVGRAVERRTAVTAFFIVATLFWLGIVWDLGVNRVVVDDSRPDRLTRNFELWETEPVREHLFLAYLGREQFERREAYTNHLQPYLFAMYGSAKLAQRVTGRSLQVGVSLTPFVMAALGAFAFAFLAARAGSLRTRTDLTFYLVLWLALGFFLTEWHYWYYLYAYNADSLFPVIVFLATVLWASTRPRPGDAARGPLVAAAIVFGAFSWMYWPLAMAALWFYYGQAFPTIKELVQRNRTLVAAMAACAVAGLVAYALPGVLVAANGYTTSDSSFAFRSGLNGDTTYFQNIAQAVFRPSCGRACAPRNWWDLLFPAFVPLVAYATWAWRRSSTEDRIFGPYVFLAAPYLFSLAIVPQSVSIHPYLYDQLLFLPAALSGAHAALFPDVRQDLRGPWLLLFFLLATWLIMTNLIGIAQGMRTILPV